MSSFPQLVREDFAFLTEEYGFRVSEEDGSSVTYTTEETRVRVLLDYSLVGVEFRPQQALIYENAWLDLWDIVHAQAPRSKFRYSCNPAAFNADREAYLRRQLKRLRGVVLQYADDFLRGDFSRRAEVEQFRKERVKREADHADSP